MKQRKFLSITAESSADMEPCCVCQVLAMWLCLSPQERFQVLHAADLLILVTVFEPLSWQEEYNDGDDIGTLDCGHVFHTKCIKQWLMQKNLCPICKTTGLLTWKGKPSMAKPEIWLSCCCIIKPKSWVENLALPSWLKLVFFVHGLHGFIKRGKRSRDWKKKIKRNFAALALKGFVYWLLKDPFYLFILITMTIMNILE